MVLVSVGNCTVDQCVKKWKTLRDRFVKKLKKVKTRKSRDAGPAYTPLWRLFEVLYIQIASDIESKILYLPTCTW